MLTTKVPLAKPPLEATSNTPEAAIVVPVNGLTGESITRPLPICVRYPLPLILFVMVTVSLWLKASVPLTTLVDVAPNNC